MVRDGLLSWKIISIKQDLIDLKERLGVAVKSSQNAGARMESDELQSSARIHLREEVLDPRVSLLPAQYLSLY